VPCRVQGANARVDPDPVKSRPAEAEPSPPSGQLQKQPRVNIFSGESPAGESDNCCCNCAFDYPQSVVQLSQSCVKPSVQNCRSKSILTRPPWLYGVTHSQQYCIYMFGRHILLYAIHVSDFLTDGASVFGRWSADSKQAQLIC